MKKKSVLMLWLLIYCGAGFSQKLIQDPYSGMEMELSIDNQYLKVLKVVPGSPADLSPIKAGDIIIRIDGEKVSEKNDIDNYFKSDRKEVALGLKNGNELSIPRVTINLFSDNYITECELFNRLFIYQRKDIYSDNTFYNSKEEYEVFDEKFQSIKNPQAYQVETSAFSGGGKVKSITYTPKSNYDNRNQITILTDNGKDISDSSTFDFDYTSQADPLMEKTLLNKLESHLKKFGLRRNSESPDIIVLINFYSGQKENYVPPQQIISTKIQDYFNWYWGYIPVPVTESKAVSGYTETSYLISISLKFLDAKKITNSKTPPEIWGGTYAEIGPAKVFLSDAADAIYKLLLFQFPYAAIENAENVSIDKFTNTGLIFDKANMNQIADVIPGSPADKAGIIKGDIISLFGKNELKWEGNQKYAISVTDDLAYLFYGSNLQDGDSRFFPPLNWHSSKFRQSSSQPVIFTGKRGSKKMKFEVNPEYVNGLFARDKAFVFK